MVAMSWSSSVSASHIIGAEIRYQCLGNNEYRVILDVYRDCYFGQAGFDEPAYVTAFDENGGYLKEPNIILDPLFTDTLDNNISDDPCLLPPSNVCVEHARYEGVYTIDEPGGIYLVYQRCCRNETITNIEMPDKTGSTYFTYITPESRAICNSSPEFDFYPPIFVCIGKEIEHEHAAQDTFNQENDSLVYRLYTPFEGASDSFPNPNTTTVSHPPYDTVVWVDPPYNLNAVLGPSSGGNLAIDPHTGLITGFPEIQGQFVVGVLVEEYRNGVLLSVTRRDFQYNVGVCVKVEAEIVADTAQCDNQTVHFGNNTNGPDNFLWYYISGPDTTFFSDEYEPTFTFPDTGKYEIMMIAEPGYDCVDTAYSPLFLQTNSLTADFSWQTYDCTEESVLVLEDLSTDSVSPVSEWFWEIIIGNDTLTSTAPDTVFVLPNPSTGTISLTVKSAFGCEQTKTVDFETGLNNPSDSLPEFIAICIGETVELNPNNPAIGFTYQWAPPVPFGQQTEANPTVFPPAPVVYNYAVTMTGYNDLCFSLDTVVVDVDPAVELDFDADTDCDARMVLFNNNSLNAPLGYAWDFGDPSTNSDVSNLTTPLYTYPDYGTYTVSLMTMPGAVCADTITETIIIEEKILEADFDFEYVQCEDGEVAISFSDISTNNQSNTTEWLWEFSGSFNGASQLQNPTIVVSEDGDLTVTLTIKTDENCIDANVPRVLNIDLTELPCLFESEVLACLEQGDTLNVCGDTSYTYTWLPIQGLSCYDCASPIANPTQTTTYTVMIENISADTCFITREIKVVVPDDVGLVVSDDVLTCDSVAMISASTTLQPVEYDWFNENNTLIADGPNAITVAVSGYENYIVRAEDEFGCYYFDTVQVVGGPADIATVGDQIMCSDDPADIFAINLDANDTLTWEWLPSGAFVSGTDTSNPELEIVSGHQTISVTATNQFGCEKTDSLELDILDADNILDFDYEVECNGSQVTFTNLSANAYNFFWDFGDPTTDSDTSHLDNPIYTYPLEGVYQVTLTLDFDLDCFTPIVDTIIIDSTQFATDFNFAYLDCNEEEVTIQFFDDTHFFVPNITIDSFLWELSNGDTSTEQNPIFTLETGDELGVNFTIWTSNDCFGTDFKFIKFEFPNAPLADSIIICSGDSVHLNPAGNASYTHIWFPNIAIDSIDVENPLVWPTQTTTYMVQVTSYVPDTCTIFKEITVFVPLAIELEVEGDTLTCGDPISATASSQVSPVNYEWRAMPGGIISTTNTLDHFPMVDTWYKVSAEDEFGCVEDTTVFVANEMIDVDLTPVGDNVCPEEFIELEIINNVDDHDTTFIWSATPPGMIHSGDSTATPAIITPTAGNTSTYSVIVGNQYGCEDSLSLTLDGYQYVPTIVESDTFCAGVPTPLNPNADSTLDYIWSPAIGFPPSEPNPIVTLTQSTVFTVIISANFGLDNCSDTIEVNIFVPEQIEINGVADTSSCGSEIELVASTNVPAEINWLDAQGGLIQSGNPFMTNPDDEETYIVTATDEFNCMEADTITVTNNELAIILDGGGMIDTCPQPFYNLCVNNFDPNDDLTFQWTAGANGEIIGDLDMACTEVSTTEGETANFSVIVSNQWGCASEETAEITTYSFDPIVRDSINICPNFPTDINPDAEGSDLIYSWTPSTGLSCDDCPNPEATLTQDQQYVVTILGVNGLDTCSFSSLVNVFINPMIGIYTDPTPDTSLCEMGDLVLSVTVLSPISGEICWYENSFDNEIDCNSEITVSPNGTVVYYALATDSLGCKDTAIITVNAHPIDVTLEEEIIFCEEEEEQVIEVINNDPTQVLTFTNWQPQQYIIDAAPDNSSIIIDNIPDVQLFTVDIENQYGCTLTDSTTVLYFNIDPLVGDITSTMDTIYFNSGEFSQLDITEFNPEYLYEWVPQDGLSDPFIHNPEAAPDVTTEYTLIVSNEFGCFAERIDTIYVLNPDCGEPYIFVPNAFTPNDDGSNDIIYVRSNIISNMELSIYDRWGELIFRTNDQNVGWDGTYKSEKLAPDVYGFYLRADCFNGQNFTKKGNVMILR